jgi:hypothetical protein
MRKGLVGTVLLLCLVYAQPAFAQRCEHARDIDLASGAESIDLTVVTAGAGALLVEGSGSEIVITGRACASDADRLANMHVNVTPRGDRLEIETDVPDISGWSWGGGRYAYIDLEIRVPAGMNVEVDDGSGDLVVRGVGSLRLEDGSDDVDVSRISGDVSIDDGSGDIDLDGIGGEVWLDDGSGNIDIDDATGSVMIHDDGLGGISVTSVSGDFTVQSDGSGGIRHSDVSGSVKIPKQR